MQAETYTRQGTGAPASNNLTPDTTYEISVAAGNDHDFGEESFTSFSISEGECCPYNNESIATRESWYTIQTDSGSVWGPTDVI
jgi:hypothetical protein